MTSTKEIIVTNDYQTKITKELLDSYPQWVQDQFMNIVTNIPFVKWMIGTERKRACELPRDEEGKIIIDVTHPHILEDMDYFRQSAIFFEENGCYTFLKPNKAKGSEFQKWFQEEKRRCLDGYVRESDGEWVTGLMYWYLNYSPIKLNRQTKRGVWHQVEHLPDFWEGVYYGFHALYMARLNGKHLIELARRGAGKSYRVASILNHNLILGEDSESQTDVNSILIAYTKEYLGDKDGTLSKFEIMRTATAKYTHFKRMMLKASPSEMIWRQGYEDENKIKHSTNNIVLGLSVKDDESKIRGKRGMLFFEEMGSMPNLTEVYGNVKDSVKDGDNVFATIYLVGTAGDDKSDFAGAKALLYEPDNNDLMSFENVWDFPGKGRERFGFFFAAYLSRSGCMDKDGNSDVVKAILAILMEHYKAKSTGDMSKYIKRKAELCITPADAMIKVTASVFPVNELNERIRQIETDPHAYDDVYIGNIVDTGGGRMVFRPSNDIPIRKWPISDNSTLGALEIYEMPVRDGNGNVMRNRYVIGVDPVDNDQAESTSLFSMFVFDMMTERIVAEFTGRKPLVDDNYRIVYNTAVFYNAIVMYEANKKMIYTYFARKNAVWMLAETPSYLRDRQLVKYSALGTAKYGVSVNAAINQLADDQINTWLMSERPVDIRGEDGEMHTVMMANLYFIRCKALLDEMVNYEPELRRKNVDRIRALSQCMLYREQFIILYGGAMPEREVKTASDDEFFDRDWNRRKIL